MKKIQQNTILMALGGLSFVLFFYLSFPYEVLKETLRSKISEATGVQVKIQDMGPRFPLGVKFRRISIFEQGGNEINMASVDAYVSFWKIFIGQLGVNVYIEDDKRGQFSLSLDFGLFDLIRGKMDLPKDVELKAEKFKIAALLNFLLKAKARDPGTNPLLAPMLKAFELEGVLNAAVSLNFDTSDLAKSKGNARFDFKDLVLVVTDPSINIPNQSFTKAQVEAKFQNGVLRISDASAFTTNDMNAAFSGQISQKPRIEDSNVNMSINVELKNQLKDQLAIVLDAIANKETNGVLSVKLTGPLSAPRPEFL